MPIRPTPVEQRRARIETQLIRLRSQLGKKSRRDFSTEYRYQSWLKRSHELIDELKSELSALEYPGEFDQLPAAIVAEELGLRLSQVRDLIKSGEIEVSGTRAHERISREELGRLAELGPGVLLILGNQNAGQIFEEAVSRLRAGDETFAKRAYRRLLARETCIGNHAIALEIALYLAAGRYEEAGRAIKFIFRERFNARAAISSHLAKFLRGACFKSPSIQADILRIVLRLDEEAAEAVKSGVIADDYQFTAMYVTAVVTWVIEESFTYALSVEQREELNQLIMNSIYTALYADADADTSISSKQFVLSAKQRIPRYWEPAILITELAKRRTV